MYGQGEFDRPRGVDLGTSTAGDGADEAPPAGGAPDLHVVQVQRGAKQTTSELLCPVCDQDDEDVVVAVQQAADEFRALVCTREWLTGEFLEAGEGPNRRQWDCWEQDPYPTSEFPQKTDKQRRYAMYTGTVRALIRTQKGCRANLPSCVRAKIESLYGESRTGFTE